MKLYYLPGACSLSAHITLHEIGNPFTIEKVDKETNTTETGEDFMLINPNGYVPAIRLEDGAILFEAPAVLQYLADTNPDAGLAPDYGSLERARMQQYLNFTASEFHKSFAPFFSGAKLSDEERERNVARVGKRLDFIEQILSDGREYLLESGFSVADTYTFTVAWWTGPTKISLENWPSVKAYVDRVSKRPSVIQAMTDEGLLS